MAYSEIDNKAVNTIRVLAVSILIPLPLLLHTKSGPAGQRKFAFTGGLRKLYTPQAWGRQKWTSQRLSMTDFSFLLFLGVSPYFSSQNFIFGCLQICSRFSNPEKKQEKYENNNNGMGKPL